MAILHCETCGHDFIAQFSTNVFCPECSLHGPAEAARLHDYAVNDVLIMCEVCGQDLLQDLASWRDTNEDGRVPLCPECAEQNPKYGSPFD
jgi:DNA-directed RNA polymerase subunit RPC12/RpoP